MAPSSATGSPLPADARGPSARRSPFARLRRDDSGATAVEMALIAAPFFAILFAIVQIGFRFFVAEALDTAVAEASRRIMTGQVQGNAAITTPAQFRDQVLCNATNRILPSFMDCNKVVVDVRRLSTFADAAFADSAADLLRGVTTPTYDPGAKGTIIVARAAYGIPAIAPSLTGGGSYLIDGEQKHALLGVFVFRNEPF
mgnify:FL=1